MHRNEKHWLTGEELEDGTWGENLEEAVVEIKNLLPRLEYAFSGVEFAAAAIRSKELGFDRHTVFWPTVFPKETAYGMAWSDDPDLVAGIGPPLGLSPTVVAVTTRLPLRSGSNAEHGSAIYFSCRAIVWVSLSMVENGSAS